MSTKQPLQVGSHCHCADSVRSAGLVIGDTIQGREHNGPHWNDAQLQLEFVGKTECVWMSRRRDDRCTDWSMWRERSDWTLSCRDWFKLEDHEINAPYKAAP